MLTEKQVELIQDSWSKVIPIQHLASGIFYTKLFSIDPSLREFFPESMDEQKKKLMTTLNVAVGGLKDIERLIPVLQKLAMRHINYGVVNEHFPTVGTALLHTLETGLGDAYTEEVATAWTTLYGIITHVMVSAMDEKRKLMEALA